MSKSIGVCDYCDYALKCNRCSCTGPSLLQQMYGCPRNLVEEWKKDCEKELQELKNK